MPGPEVEGTESLNSRVQGSREQGPEILGPGERGFGGPRLLGMREEESRGPDSWV